MSELAEAVQALTNHAKTDALHNRLFTHCTRWLFGLPKRVGGVSGPALFGNASSQIAPQTLTC